MLLSFSLVCVRDVYVLTELWLSLSTRHKKTGSGKTISFLLPAFHHFLQKGRPPQGYSKPKLLTLAPTRELSVQIMEEAVKFGRPLGIRSICCYGGSSKWPQINTLQCGVECVIATPGRLNDLLEMKKVDLSEIECLVLDEADRMLDMGCELRYTHF